MKYGKIIYYSTPSDEVIYFKNKEKYIDKNYKYSSNNPFYNFLSSFIFKTFVLPIATIYKLTNNIKFHNKKILKQFKNGGYFIYANHTNQFADGFCPSLITFPKKSHIIVNSSNLTIPIIGKFAKIFGTIVIPNTIEATKNFYSHIENTLNKNQPILIYPEAHLWPYYTKIRDFPLTSFHYPIKFNKPCFTFTTTYTKKNHKKKPKIDIYVDGPFYPNKNLPIKLAQAELKTQIFNKLNERAKLSNYEFIQYIKREKLSD